MPIPSVADLEAQLSTLGWTLSKITAPNPTTGRYVVKAVGPGGQKVSRDGKTPEMALSAMLAFAQRSNTIRSFARLAALFKTAGAWNLPIEHRLEEIGQRYAELPVYDPKAVPAWQALAEESQRQADALRNQLKIKVTDDPEPYPHHAAMIHDIHHNQNFVVSRAHSDHPVWTPDQNVNFRIVHDVMGHGGSGGDFGWLGETQACSHHYPMISPLARQALTTECLGQTGYALRKGSHGFGPQKMALMEDLTNEFEKQNGQMPWVPHGEDWRVPAQPNEVMPLQGVQNAAWGWVRNPQTGEWEQNPEIGDTRESRVFIPERYGTGIPNPSHAPADPETGSPLWDESAPYLAGKDPNASWEVPEEMRQHALPAPAPGSPDDYLDRMGGAETSGKMEVPWWERDKDGNWVYPVDEQKRIILNAFRVAMLSPLKELKFNAAHYQGIYDMPATAKAHEMWERLDNERRRYNAAHGHDPMGHLSYWKEIKALGDWVQVQTGLSHAQAMDEAKRRVFKKLTEVEAELDPNGEGDPLRTELEAHKLVGAWIKSLVKNQMFNQWETYDPDEWSDTPAEQHEQLALAHTAADQLALDPSLEPAAKGDKYAGFMGTHLDAISQVGQHIDDVRAAALKDIYTDDGRGFVFRNAIMNMDIKGVNPKVASFIWLLLYPKGSQLGIVDTHIARAFQRPYDEIGTPKDYYKLERMQKTMRDMSGYGDMPLGQYHHGMWDLVRSKDWQQGWEHSDHSPLRIDEPTPWDQHDWTGDLATAKMGTDWVGPQQMEYARPYAEQVGQMYEDEHAGLPRGKVPRLVPVQAAKKRGLFGWGGGDDGPFGREGDPEAIKRGEWESGTANEMPEGVNPLDPNRCPHCLRQKNPNPENTMCPTCYKDYNEPVDPEHQRQWGAHPSQYPDHVVQGWVDKIPTHVGFGNLRPDMRLRNQVPRYPTSDMAEVVAPPQMWDYLHHQGISGAPQYNVTDKYRQRVAPGIGNGRSVSDWWWHLRDKDSPFDLNALTFEGQLQRKQAPVVQPPQVFQGSADGWE